MCGSKYDWGELVDGEWQFPRYLIGGKPPRRSAGEWINEREVYLDCWGGLSVLMCSARRMRRHVSVIDQLPQIQAAFQRGFNNPEKYSTEFRYPEPEQKWHCNVCGYEPVTRPIGTIHCHVIGCAGMIEYGMRGNVIGTINRIVTEMMDESD